MIRLRDRAHSTVELTWETRDTSSYPSLNRASSMDFQGLCFSMSSQTPQTASAVFSSFSSLREGKY